MELSADHLDAASLAELGDEARQLLCSGNFIVLAQRFGYALAFDREPADAIREDLASCLAGACASKVILTGLEAPKVTYFKPNDTGLVALVECFAPTDNGKAVQLEVIVTANGKKTHATLEQLSAAV